MWIHLEIIVTLKYSNILTLYLVVSYRIILDPFNPLIFSLANSFINIIICNINNQSRIVSLIYNTIYYIQKNIKNQFKSSSDNLICMIGRVKFGYSVNI